MSNRLLIQWCLVFEFNSYWRLNILKLFYISFVQKCQKWFVFVLKTKTSTQFCPLLVSILPWSTVPSELLTQAKLPIYLSPQLLMLTLDYFEEHSIINTHIRIFQCTSCLMIANKQHLIDSYTVADRRIPGGARTSKAAVPTYYLIHFLSNWLKMKEVRSRGASLVPSVSMLKVVLSNIWWAWPFCAQNWGVTRIIPIPTFRCEDLLALRYWVFHYLSVNCSQILCHVFAWKKK